MRADAGNSHTDPREHAAEPGGGVFLGTTVPSGEPAAQGSAAVREAPALAQDRGDQVGDLETTIVPDGEDYRLTGQKRYCTGSIFADWINVSARTPERGRARVTVAVDDPGVEVRDDWDGFGQILTGSGSTLFREVRVPAPLVGVGRAALRDGIEFVRSRTRVYSQGSGATAASDPLVQQVVGRLSAKVAAAAAAVAAAARALAAAQEAAFAGSRDGADEGRGAELTDAAELRTIQAQISVVEDILEVTTQLFEVGGASATSRGRGLDRHWRNARTLASHHPVIYQERAVGDRLLSGTDLLYF